MEERIRLQVTDTEEIAQKSTLRLQISSEIHCAAPSPPVMDCPDA